jgi:hypothetical protein
VDALAMEWRPFIARRMRQNPAMMDQLVDVLAAQRERSTKPFWRSRTRAHVEDVMIELRKKLLERGWRRSGTSGGGEAFARANQYWRFREGQ